MAKYDVGYFRCVKCGSLQTEEPYWLAEAYSADVPEEDAAYLSRNLEVARHAKLMLHLFGVPKSATVVDFGGGLGIVARLLAESGWTTFVHDKFTASPFPGIKWTEGRKADFLLASEVFEHLPNPAQDLEEVFGLQPRFLYARTTRYRHEGSDWFYLAPETGQHVFFFTDEAMRMLASRYGYHVTLPTSEDAVFSAAPLGPTKRWGLKTILSRKLRRLKLAAAGV
jgi:hypothetical protein